MKGAADLTIVAAGCAAAGITAGLASRNEEKLLRKYHKGFVEKAKNVPASDEEILRILLEHKQEKERIFRTDLSGVYDTLWEIGEAYSCGLTVDAYRVPILTETVEVCELLDLDPFAVPAQGMVFVLTDAPVRILGILKEHGVPAEIAGRLTDTKARILIVGERQRFLAKPEKADPEGTFSPTDRSAWGE